MTHHIELVDAGAEPVRLAVAAAVDVGRECDGVVLRDPRVSRRHLCLTPAEGGLLVDDLGSANGTVVNGRRIAGTTRLTSGDVVTFGDSWLRVLEPTPDGDEPAGAPPGFVTRRSADVTIGYRPGTAGELAAGPMVDAARRARRRLADLAPDRGGQAPMLYLVDPFADPATGELVTSGTFVDVARGEIWMVVTPDAPPEPPERPFAVVLGAALPAGAELEALLEGYGLYAARVADPAPVLRGRPLPPLVVATGELRVAMALSFVSFLVERAGRDAFVRFLHETRPGTLDATAEVCFGAGLSALEEVWRRQLAASAGPVKTSQFLRTARRYLRPYRAREVELFAYMLLALSFTIAFPFVMRRLINDLVTWTTAAQGKPVSGHFGDVGQMLAILGVAFVLSLLGGLRRTYVAAYVSGSVVRRLRVEMFERLQQLPISWYTQRQQGDVLSRLFTDVGAVEQGLTQTLREGAFQLLSLVVAAFVLLQLNVPLGIVVLLAAPLVAIVYRLMADGARRRSLVVQEQAGGVTAIAAENYSAQGVVKAFGLEVREGERFRRASDRLFTSGLRLNLFGGLFGVGVGAVVTGLRLLILGLGAWLILRGSLSIGGLTAFMSLMGEVLNPVTALTNVGQQLQASSGALVRVNEVLDALPELTDRSGAQPLPRIEREIHIAHVDFSYLPGQRTLADIDVTIPAGARVAFVGPTGAGKSSLLQLLMRFYDPDDGAILFDGLDARDVTIASLRGQLGVVFQETFLFNATVRDNIALGAETATDEEIVAAARAAELDEFITSLPQGYRTLVGERGARLSGGQRQRLAIARALVRDPRVLLLDEATSALDPHTERVISETIVRAGEGRTTIAVTHRLTSVTEFDRIFVVVGGRIAQQGRHEELLEQGGPYAALWAEQIGADRAGPRGAARGPRPAPGSVRLARPDYATGRRVSSPSG